MKKILFALLLFPTMLWAQNSGFTVTGKVEGIKDGEVKILSTQEGAALVAKGESKGGVFTVKGTIPEPGLYWLEMAGEQPQHIYLENTDIKVTGAKKEIKNIKVTGSQSHNDFDDFRQMFNPLVGELQAAGAQIQKTNDEVKRANLMQRYDSLVQKINSEIDNFISKKPASYVSAFVLFVTAQLNEDPVVLEQRFNRLDERIRKSGIGNALTEFIAYNKVGALGSDALEFTQADPTGKPVSLSSFRGKYVLIDFWASWCKPCRMENPNVVEAYNKYKDKNFTILGVSLDREKDAWVKAIEKDGLTWTQVSDLQYWNNEAAVLYHVQGIPQNFLIDPNGKIVGKNLRGADLEAKLEELLGKK